MKLVGLAMGTAGEDEMPICSDSLGMVLFVEDGGLKLRVRFMMGAG